MTHSFKLRVIAMLLAAVGGAALIVHLSYGVTKNEGDQIARPLNWENPFTRTGVRVSSIAAATAKIAFKPITPLRLGPTRGVFVANPNNTEGAAALGLVYQHATYGRFIVIERPTKQTEADLKQFLRYNTSLSSTAHFSLVKLQSGAAGLVETGPVSNSIEWIRSGLDITILGPPNSFSVTEALAVANSL